MVYLGHELQECMKTYNSVNILVREYGSVHHTQSFSVIIATHKLLSDFTLHFSLCNVGSLLVQRCFHLCIAETNSEALHLSTFIKNCTRHNKSFPSWKFPSQREHSLSGIQIWKCWRSSSFVVPIVVFCAFPANLEQLCTWMGWVGIDSLSLGFDKDLVFFLSPN